MWNLDVSAMTSYLAYMKTLLRSQNLPQVLVRATQRECGIDFILFPHDIERTATWSLGPSDFANQRRVLAEERETVLSFQAQRPIPPRVIRGLKCRPILNVTNKPHRKFQWLMCYYLSIKYLDNIEIIKY